MPEPEAIHGTVVDASNPEALRKAIEMAFDYRGDVTITTKADGRSVQGYIFDRREGPTLAGSTLRLIRSEGEERITIRYDEVARITFSGRDTAAGKSFETWMKRYVRQKLAGERANIENEPLDDP